MKVTLHYPTEQYGFAEVEAEIESVDEAIPLYESGKVGTGVEEKEMNYVFDAMLAGGGVNGGIEIYERMNPTQKYAVQALKRALKRMAGKEQKLHRITQ